MCVNIIYVCICLYCVICLILYYRSLLICTNKEFMNNIAADQKVAYVGTLNKEEIAFLCNHSKIS